MRTIYELEEEDIVKIVADKFNVEPERIDVSYGTKTTNMGTIEESTQPIISVPIITEQEVDDVV